MTFHIACAGRGARGSTAPRSRGRGDSRSAYDDDARCSSRWPPPLCTAAARRARRSAELHHVRSRSSTGQMMHRHGRRPAGRAPHARAAPRPARARAVDRGPRAGRDPDAGADAAGPAAHADADAPTPDARPHARRAEQAPARRARRHARHARRPATRAAARTTDPAAPDKQAERPGADTDDPQAQGRGTRSARRRDAVDAATGPQRRRHADARQPDLLAADPRRRPDRRAELLHRQVPDPAVPAPDLPGRRHPVRHPLGGPGGDQRDRDRLRPQPEHLLRRRRRLDAVHARHLEDVRRRRQPDGKKDPFNPVDAIFAAARYLRAAGGDKDIRKAIFAYNHADWYVDSVLLRARVIGGLPGQPRRLAHRPHAGPLPGRRQGHLRRRPLRARHQATKGKGNKAVVVESGAQRRGHQDLLQEGRARRRRQRRPRHRDRHKQAARPLRQAAGRLRQHVHVRAPGQGRQALPGAEAAERSHKRAIEQELKLPTSDAAPARPGLAARPRRRPRRARRSASTPRRAKTRRAGKPAARRARQAAPVRQPRPPERREGRRRPAGLRAHRMTASAQLPQPGVRARPHRRRLKRSRRARASSSGTVLGRIGKTTAAQGPAPALRDPPGRPRRPADRPEADPRRLEAARVDRDLPRRRQEPVLRRRRQAAVDRPDPADEQGGARRSACSPTRTSRSTTAAAATSRPARSTGACWRRSSSSPPPGSSRP